MSVETALREAKRLKRERQARDQPIVVFISGDPEPPRLLGRSLSAREAMIGTEVFSATDGESDQGVSSPDGSKSPESALWSLSAGSESSALAMMRSRRSAATISMDRPSP